MDESEKEGTVLKYTNLVKGYQRRKLYVNVSDRTLVYFDRQECRKEFSMAFCRSVRTTHRNEVVVELDSKTLFFKVTDSSERASWLGILRRAADLDTRREEAAERRISPPANEAKLEPTSDEHDKAAAPKPQPHHDEWDYESASGEESLDGYQLIARPLDKPKQIGTAPQFSKQHSNDGRPLPARPSLVSSVVSSGQTGVSSGKSNTSYISLILSFIVLYIGLVVLARTFSPTSHDVGPEAAHSSYEHRSTREAKPSIFEAIKNAVVPQPALLPSHMVASLAQWTWAWCSQNSFLRAYWWLVIASGTVLVVSGLSIISPAIQPAVVFVQTRHHVIRAIFVVLLAASFVKWAIDTMSLCRSNFNAALYQSVAAFALLARALHLLRGLRDPSTTMRNLLAMVFMAVSLSCWSVAGDFSQRPGFLTWSVVFRMAAGLSFVTALQAAKIKALRRQLGLLGRLPRPFAGLMLAGASSLFLFQAPNVAAFTMLLGIEVALSFALSANLVKAMSLIRQQLYFVIGIEWTIIYAVPSVAIAYITWPDLNTNIRQLASCDALGCYLTAAGRLGAMGNMCLVNLVVAAGTIVFSIHFPPRVRLFLRNLWRHQLQHALRFLAAISAFTASMLFFALELSFAQELHAQDTASSAAAIAAIKATLSALVAHALASTGGLLFQATRELVSDFAPSAVWIHGFVAGLLAVMSTAVASISQRPLGVVQITKTVSGLLISWACLNQLARRHRWFRHLKQEAARMLDRVALGVEWAAPWLRVAALAWATHRFVSSYTLVDKITLPTLGYALAGYTCLVILVCMLGVATHHEGIYQHGLILYEHLDLGLSHVALLCWRIFCKIAARLWELRRLPKAIINTVMAAGSRLWTVLLRPFSLGIRRFLIGVWRSPLVPFVTSALVIVVAVLLHNDVVQLPEVHHASSVLSAPQHLLRAISAVVASARHLPLLNLLVDMVWSTFSSVWEELGNWHHTLTRVEGKQEIFHSLSFAWSVYVVNLVFGKTGLQRVARVKLAVVPICIVGFSAAYAPHILPAASAVALLWLAIATAVHIRDYAERRAARARLRQLHNEERPRGRGPTRDEMVEKVMEELVLAGKPVRCYSSESCSICMMEFAASDTKPVEGEEQPPSAEVWLPCGHKHHYDCLAEWFVQCRGTPRCPLCQDPVDSVSQAVGVIF